MEATLLPRVLDIVADVLGRPREALSVDTSADDFENWDSVNILNLAMALEGEFKVTLNPEEIVDMHSVRSILEALRNRGVE